MANMATLLYFHFGHGWPVCHHNSLTFWRLSHHLKKVLAQTKRIVFKQKSIVYEAGPSRCLRELYSHHGGLHYKLDPSEGFIEQ